MSRAPSKAEVGRLGGEASQAKRLERVLEQDEEALIDGELCDHRACIESAALLLVGKSKLKKWGQELVKAHMENLVLQNKNIDEARLRLIEKANMDQD
jgi:hypothetical protein